MSRRRRVLADPLDARPRSQLRRELSVILAPRHGLLACAGMSAALLVGAFLFEYVGGMAPCSLCIWQRWAHVAVIVASMTGLLMLPSRTALLLPAAAALASFGIAGYHAGVEWQLWAGPAGCTANLKACDATTCHGPCSGCQWQVGTRFSASI